MSKYTKDEQVKIIGWAMNLEAAIQSEKAQLSSLRNMMFKPKPNPPSAPETIQPDYPKMPKVSFSNYLKDNTSTIGKLLSKQNIIKIVIALIVLEIIGNILMATPLSAIGIIISTVSWFIVPAVGGLYIKEYFEFLKNRKELSNKLAQNTPEYIKAYNEAERLAKEKQEALNLRYAKDKEKYETQIVPMYNQELSNWNASQEMKINVISDDLNANLDAQESLYNETKLIPKNNRSLNDLIWIYEDMSTSEHDLERAIDMLNANKQLAQSNQIKEAVNNMNNNMQNSFSAVYCAIENGNDIALEINDRLGKTRRDMNIGNIVSTVQRHNINKKL